MPNRGQRVEPADVHVGQRIRERRIACGISQEQLARSTGVTFQQVQKYERGVNRVGAARLYAMAKALDVPITYFFDDMAADVESSGRGGKAESLLSGLPAGREAEALSVLRAFVRIDNDNVRHAAAALVRSLAGSDAEDGPVSDS